MTEYYYCTKTQKQREEERKKYTKGLLKKYGFIESPAKKSVRIISNSLSKIAGLFL